MRYALILLVAAVSAFAQTDLPTPLPGEPYKLGPNPNSIPNGECFGNNGGALGGFACSGGGAGTPAYSQAIAAQTTTTVSEATHGQGTKPFAFCFDNSTPAKNVSCAYTVDGSGNIVFTWSPAFTGTVVIDGATGGFANPMTTAYQHIGSGPDTTGTAHAIPDPSNIFSVDTFTSALYPGIGQAVGAWSGGTAYPVCNVVSYAPSVAVTISLTSNVLTITATNTFIGGDRIDVSGLSNGAVTFLNGQTLVVSPNSLSGSSFQAKFTHANVGSTSDTATLTNNYISVAANTGITPGSDTTNWWRLQYTGSATSTSTDCAFYVAAAAAQLNGVTTAIQFNGSPTFSNPYVTNLGLFEPNSQSQVDILGTARGNKGGLTRLKAGASSITMIGSPDKATGTSLPNDLTIRNLTLDANNVANQCFSIFGENLFVMEHVSCKNWNQTTGVNTPAAIGDGTTPFNNGGYQNIISDVYISGQGNTQSSWATLTITGSGSSLSVVVSGTNSYMFPPAHVILLGAPCAVAPAFTVTYTGTGPYAVNTVTASGESGCVGPYSAYIPDTGTTQYGMIFSLITDSSIHDVVTSTGWQYGIFENGGSANHFSHAHSDAPSQYQIAAFGQDDQWYTTEPDTTYNIGIYSTAATNTFTGTVWANANSASPFAGTSLFWLPTGGTIFGNTCPNTNTGGPASNLAFGVSHGGPWGNVTVIAGRECDTQLAENAYPISSGSAGSRLLGLTGTAQNSTITGNTSSQTLTTFTIPANAMASTSCLAFEFMGYLSSSSGGSKVFTVSFGATSESLAAITVTSGMYTGRARICNLGAVNSQYISFPPMTASNNTTGTGVFGTAAIDTTSAVTLSLSWVAAATEIIQVRLATVELLQ